MRPPLPDDVVTEIRWASLDLREHLALRRMQRIAIELRYRDDQPRAPRGNPDGGQWIRDTIHPPNVRPHGEAVRRPRPYAPLCDGFSGGCQNGGSFGTSGIFIIGERKLCWDCAIKFFSLEDEPRKEQVRYLSKFLRPIGE